VAAAAAVAVMMAVMAVAGALRWRSGRHRWAPGIGEEVRRCSLQARDGHSPRTPGQLLRKQAKADPTEKAFSSNGR